MLLDLGFLDQTTPAALCRRDQFRCANGQCIAGYLACNGAKNCFDGSDEMGCCEYFLFTEHVPRVLPEFPVPEHVQ